MSRYSSKLSCMIICILALLCPALAPRAHADENMEKFFTKQITPLWSVFGMKFPNHYSSEDNLNDSCVAAANFTDGSTFRIFRDLINENVWLQMTNMTWEIEDKINLLYEARLNFYNGGRTTASYVVKYKLLAKNRIIITGLDEKLIARNFKNSDRILVVMGGTIHNVAIPMGKWSDDIAEGVYECMQTYRTLSSKATTPPTQREEIQKDTF